MCPTNLATPGRGLLPDRRGSEYGSEDSVLRRGGPGLAGVFGSIDPRARKITPQGQRIFLPIALIGVLAPERPQDDGHVTVNDIRELSCYLGLIRSPGASQFMADRVRRDQRVSLDPSLSPRPHPGSSPGCLAKRFGAGSLAVVRKRCRATLVNGKGERRQEGA